MKDRKGQFRKDIAEGEKRAAEEPARLVKEQARKKTDLAREQAISKDQEKRGMHSG